MKEWSANAKEQMRFLGNFGPTVNAQEMFVKGYVLDEDGPSGCKCYLNPKDLRAIALACEEVANWLEVRAMRELPPL